MTTQLEHIELDLPTEIIFAMEDTKKTRKG